MVGTRNLSSLFTVALFAACNGSPFNRGDGSALHTELVQYQSCYELEGDLKRMMRAQIEASFEQWDRPVPFDAQGAPEAGTSPNSSDSATPRTPGQDFSTTNNQEAGVDEADFVKTDGYRIYVLNSNRLHIFDVPSFGQLAPLSSTELEGQPQELLVDREAGRAVVFSTIHVERFPEGHPVRAEIGSLLDGRWYWRVHQLSKITVLDISNPGEPSLLRELYMEGNYQTARLVDGTVRAGIFGQLEVPGLYDWYNYGNDLDAGKARALRKLARAELADLIPRIYERSASGSLRQHQLSTGDCRSFYRPMNSHGSGVTSLFSLDLFADRLKFDADHVVSNSPTIYASDDRLVIAERANDSWWYWWNEDVPELLNLHVFDSEVAGKSLYIGSGRVEGQLHNQFSIDEHNGFIRVATTSNFQDRWWRERSWSPENHLFVLGKDGGHFEVVGHLDGIAKNERIFSARLVGDRGYLVTFERVDPLFTLDLSDPTNPKVVGELEIPGFSTYLHPLDDDRLLSIGVGGDEFGATWDAQVSMYDVSDFANPTQADVQELTSAGSWGTSEALYEHKAFQYFAPKGLLAVPVSSYGNSASGWNYSSQLRLIRVNGMSLSPYGTIDHSDLYNSGSDTYWSYVDIRRSIFMGNYIYAISDRGITVHSLEAGLPEVTQQTLPGTLPDDQYWWW